MIIYLQDLPVNTLTLYLAPFFFSPDIFKGNYSFRLGTIGEFFDDEGYLKPVGIKNLLSELYFIGYKEEVHNWDDMVKAVASETIFRDNGQVFILKLKARDMNFSVAELTDMQNVVNLRVSALSRNAKNRIKAFWSLARPEISTKIDREMYPSPQVRYDLAKELDMEVKLIQSMTDIAEAIKWSTDSVEGICRYLQINCKN